MLETAIRRVGNISIHALREEGDRPPARCPDLTPNFYPRPPRGGRQQITTHDGVTATFLSTPSARRATGTWKRTEVRTGISIHALREEGDHRATAGRLGQAISIHALREEGDPPTNETDCLTCGFLSTPSARRATHYADPTPTAAIFLSTPSARRATASVILFMLPFIRFLSTPSARRATGPVRMHCSTT